MRKQISSPIGDEGGQHKLTYEWMSEIKIASVSSSYNCLTAKWREKKGAELEGDGMKVFIIYFDKMKKVVHDQMVTGWYQCNLPCGKE